MRPSGRLGAPIPRGIDLQRSDPDPLFLESLANPAREQRRAGSVAMNAEITSGVTKGAKVVERPPKKIS